MPVQTKRTKKKAGLWPPGHTFSPIPDLADVERNEERVFAVPSAIPGVDLNQAGQLEMLEILGRYYDEQPYSERAVEGLRYDLENPAFGPADALVLYGMLRHFEPARVIEVGSGHSSCVILDVNEHHLNGRARCTFVEPFPKLLLRLTSAADRDAVTILPSRLQDVDRSIFEQLQGNDVLFIDSTHVSKIDSDVNHLFFDVLPRLQPGVVVHVHDVFYPFEYPKEWIYEGRFWNENYLLKAFLQFNTSFEILFFNHYMTCFHTEAVRERMPLVLEGGAGSLWMRRRR